MHQVKNAIFSTSFKYVSMKSFLDISIAWLFGLFIPILTYLQAVYTITFMDFIIGVSVAMLGKQNFSWQKAARLIAKFVCWTGLLVATYQFQILLKIPTFNIGEFEISIALGVAGVVAYAEIKSILKNIKTGFDIDITGWVNSRFSFLKNLDTEQKKDDNTE
jgi:hypothetical protein